MNTGRRWLAPAVALFLLFATVGWLFKVRLGGGEVYPPYSSLRADALGTRAFYEALEQIPGMQVERDYRPLAKLGAEPRLILLPGLHWMRHQSMSADQLAAVNRAVNRGARVVLAFRADLVRDDLDPSGLTDEEEKEERDREKEEEEKTADPKDKDAPDAKAKKAKEPADKKAPETKVTPDPEAKVKPPAKAKRPGHREGERKELSKEWKVTFKKRWLMNKFDVASRLDGAQRTAEAPAELPEQVAWKSDVYFSLEKETDWRVLYRRGGEAVMIEKSLGRGSIVLLADAYGLSNEAVHRERATGLLSYLVADHRRVTFVESALGVLEENGVGYLARRYGLGGALALCALLGGLYAWRHGVAFLPPQDGEMVAGGVILAYEPTAGFTGLLRRALGAAELLPTCVAEWRKAVRRGGNPTATARLDAAWKNHDPKQPPAPAYNALVRALKPR